MASLLKRAFDVFFIILIALVVFWAGYNFLAGGDANAQDAQAATDAQTAILAVSQQDQ